VDGSATRLGRLALDRRTKEMLTSSTRALATPVAAKQRVPPGTRVPCKLLSVTKSDTKSTTNNLPLKLQTFASLLDSQPPEVQEAFQFLLATAVHEAGKQAKCSAWCGQR
jgi:hypothetical protein